mgnify:CR=1 FL=1
MLQYNVLYIKHITGERGSMLNFIRGFCMALADSVPGVSGGTVAFLLGFYDKFIMSLDHLMSGTKEEESYKNRLTDLCSNSTLRRNTRRQCRRT